jgi:hypothetical protein
VQHQYLQQQVQPKHAAAICLSAERWPAIVLSAHRLLRCNVVIVHASGLAASLLFSLSSCCLICARILQPRCRLLPPKSPTRPHLRCCGSVCCLCHKLALQLVSIAGVNDTADGCRYKDVTGEVQQLFLGDHRPTTKLINALACMAT